MQTFAEVAAANVLGNSSIYNINGNAGIGTMDPEAILHVTKEATKFLFKSGELYMVEKVLILYLKMNII